MEKRRFGGLLYKRVKYVKLKSEANKIAKSQRKKGYNARVFKHVGYGNIFYSVYIRKK
jgi:hypothetical protein